MRQLIRRVKPDTVFVELCESRGKALRSTDKKPFDVMQELLGAAFGGPGGLFKALMKVCLLFSSVLGHGGGLHSHIVVATPLIELGKPYPSYTNCYNSHYVRECSLAIL